MSTHVGIMIDLWPVTYNIMALSLAFCCCERESDRVRAATSFLQTYLDILAVSEMVAVVDDAMEE